MSTSRPILSVRNLNRSYPSGGGILTVMAGAAIDIYPGEMVGLVGPSGSGKSTLLHAAGLLEKPNEGEVFINGRECLKLSDDERTRIRRESIGVVYQFHHLQKEFTALENVAIPQLAYEYGTGWPYDPSSEPNVWRRATARCDCAGIGE